VVRRNLNRKTRRDSSPDLPLFDEHLRGWVKQNKQRVRQEVGDEGNGVVYERYGIFITASRYLTVRTHVELRQHRGGLGLAERLQGCLSSADQGPIFSTQEALTSVFSKRIVTLVEKKLRRPLGRLYKCHLYCLNSAGQVEQRFVTAEE